MKTKKVLVSVICLASFLFTAPAFAATAKYYTPASTKVKKHMSAKTRNKMKEKYCLYLSKSFNITKCSHIYK
ncbi:MAG: hypothetical protein WCV59_04015 [Parcubacteria group bacterium]|jgi:hypothetical protein